MSLTKRYLEEMTEDGMNLGAAEGHYVCAGCFEDYALKSLITQNAEENHCDFCKASAATPIAASVTTVVRHMNDRVVAEFDMADNCLPYDSGEGGFQGDTWDTYDLLRDELELDLPNDEGGRLFQMLCDALGDRTWCKVDPGGFTENERLLYSWQSFCTLIQHQRRFFFLSPGQTARRPDDQLLGPEEILPEIARLCTHFDLVRTFPRGTRVFRVRQQGPGKILGGPLDLGPPPEEFAVQANRMSPPGIPLLYASKQEQTALLETASEPGTFVVGVFEMQRDVRILDLTRVPSVPSIFDERRAETRGALQFLRAFVREASRPITRDDRIHVDYVPTQVVTEYFREHYRDAAGSLDGIAYPSARHRGGVCYAVFAGQHDLVVSAADIAHLDPSETFRWRLGEGWICLIDQHVRILTAADIATE